MKNSHTLPFIGIRATRVSMQRRCARARTILSFGFFCFSANCCCFRLGHHCDATHKEKKGIDSSKTSIFSLFICIQKRFCLRSHFRARFSFWKISRKPKWFILLNSFHVADIFVFLFVSCVCVSVCMEMIHCLCV